MSAGRAHLELLPQLGGSIAGFWWQVADGPIHWLRRFSRLSGRRPVPNDMSCFPLVPYSNRIRDGRFRFGGRTIALPLNVVGQTHSLHGQGWQSPWDVVATGADSVTLEYRHAPDAWPYQYCAAQAFSLSEERLDVTISVLNESDAPMPAGLGLHPYFDRFQDTRIRARVDKVWLIDSEVMPTRLVTPPVRWQLGGGVRVDGLDIDTLYTGWDGRVLIDWPDRGAQLTIGATVPLDNLIIFAPPGADFFCAEPVSHITDAFNLEAAGVADTGMRVLAAGERMQAKVSFTPALNG